MLVSIIMLQGFLIIVYIDFISLSCCMVLSSLYLAQLRRRGSSRDTLFIQPPHHVHVPTGSGVYTDVVAARFIQSAPDVVQPLQHLQVPGPSGGVARATPRAPGVVQPLQNIQVPARSSGCTRRCGPREPGIAQPRQHLEVPATSGEVTRPLVPRAPGTAQPLQHLQVPATSGERTSISETQPWAMVHVIGHVCGAPLGEALLVLRPLHQRCRPNRRRARAIHPRERREVPGPHPRQHLRL